jgi:hypothetical protein
VGYAPSYSYGNISRIFLLYRTPFFFAIFVIEIYVGKYAENDGEVRIWGSDLVSKLSANEVRYFKFTVPIMKIDASKASLPI